jgi:hypothetical protein
MSELLACRVIPSRKIVLVVQSTQLHPATSCPGDECDHVFFEKAISWDPVAKSLSSFFSDLGPRFTTAVANPSTLATARRLGVVSN